MGEDQFLVGRQRAFAVICWLAVSLGIVQAAEPAPQFRDPRSPPTTVLVGDLVLTLPIGRGFSLLDPDPSNRPLFGYHGETPPRFRSIGINTLDAQAFVGLHDHIGADNYDDLSIQIQDSEGRRPVIDSWCANVDPFMRSGRLYDDALSTVTEDGLHIFPGATGSPYYEVGIPIEQHYIFNSPVVFSRWSFSNSPIPRVKRIMYSTLIAVTDQTYLYLRFRLGALDGASIADLLAKIDVAVTKITSTTPNLAQRLYHQPSQVCPDQGQP